MPVAARPHRHPRLRRAARSLVALPALVLLTVLVVLPGGADPLPSAAAAAGTTAISFPPGGARPEEVGPAGPGMTPGGYAEATPESGTWRVVRGRRSLVLGWLPRRHLVDLARLADQAARHVRPATSGGSSGPARRAGSRLVLVLPRTAAQAATYLGRDESSLAGLAAVTTTLAVTGGAHRPAGARTRVVINPPAFARLSALGRRVVLAHEAAHVATRAVTSARTPLWLVEGFADWVAYRSEHVAVDEAAAELLSSVRAGRALRQLPTRAQLVQPGPGRAAAYEGAWLACRLIARRWGASALVDLYRHSGAGQSAALRTALRTSTPVLTALWRDELRRPAR